MLQISPLVWIFAALISCFYLFVMNLWRCCSVILDGISLLFACTEKYFHYSTKLKKKKKKGVCEDMTFSVFVLLIL